MGAVLPSIITFACLITLTVLAAVFVGRRDDAVEARLFDRDAGAAFAEVEGEIEDHLDVIDDLTAFADATWPGEPAEWLRYIERRVTGGTGLAFTSTAGLVERVAPTDIDAFLEREGATDPSFAISEPFPLPPGQDRLVLTRIGRQNDNGVEPRGTELTAAAQLIGLELPAPDDRVTVTSLDEAPAAIFEVLGIQPSAFADNDVIGSNVLFVSAVGDAGSPAQGWVAVPADLSYLLVNAVEELSGDVSMAVRIPDAEIDGDLGRYSGAGDLLLDDADFVMVRQLELGGWRWSVEIWGNRQGTSLIDPQLVLLAGAALSILFTILAETRRRHRRHLLEAQVELGLQRTLAETDHLTGLLNRQGLASVLNGVDRNDSGLRVALRGSGTVFFIDLDGFKAINDELGHAIGDEVLDAVAQAIRSVARKEDLAVRLGGDEFLVVCPGLCDAALVTTRVGEIEQAIADLQRPVPVGASVGWASAERSIADELDGLIAAADEAMYRNKFRRRSPSAAG